MKNGASACGLTSILWYPSHHLQCIEDVRQRKCSVDDKRPRVVSTGATTAGLACFPFCCFLNIHFIYLKGSAMKRKIGQEAFGVLVHSPNGQDRQETGPSLIPMNAEARARCTSSEPHRGWGSQDSHQLRRNGGVASDHLTQHTTKLPLTTVSVQASGSLQAGDPQM